MTHASLLSAAETQAASTATSIAPSRWCHRGRLRGAQRPGRPVAPGQALLAARGPRRGQPARVQRHADRRRGRGADLRHLLELQAQQPHRLRLAAAGQHRHRRRSRCSTAPCSTTCCPSHRRSRPATTTTGSPRSRWRSAESATSTVRCTTTCSTAGRRWATWRPTRSAGNRRSMLARLRARAATARRLRSLHLGWRWPYFKLYCRIAVNVAILQLRCGDRMTDSRRRTPESNLRLAEGRGVACAAGHAIAGRAQPDPGPGAHDARGTGLAPLRAPAAPRPPASLASNGGPARIRAPAAPRAPPPRPSRRVRAAFGPGARNPPPGRGRGANRTVTASG